MCLPARPVLPPVRVVVVVCPSLVRAVRVRTYEYYIYQSYFIISYRFTFFFFPFWIVSSPPPPATVASGFAGGTRASCRGFPDVRRPGALRPFFEKTKINKNKRPVCFYVSSFTRVITIVVVVDFPRVRECFNQSCVRVRAPACAFQCVCACARFPFTV